MDGQMLVVTQACRNCSKPGPKKKAMISAAGLASRADPGLVEGGFTWLLHTTDVAGWLAGSFALRRGRRLFGGEDDGRVWGWCLIHYAMSANTSAPLRRISRMATSSALRLCRDAINWTFWPPPRWPRTSSCSRWANPLCGCSGRNSYRVDIMFIYADRSRGALGDRPGEGCWNMLGPSKSRALA